MDGALVLQRMNTATSELRWDKKINSRAMLVKICEVDSLKRLFVKAGDDERDVETR